MEQITIPKQTLVDAYNQAEAPVKALLEGIYGGATFEPNITDRVKTFEDACKLVNISKDMQDLLNYKGDDPDMKSSQAHMKITIIARALNQGWTPNFADGNQVKYYPWPEYKAGVGFSSYDYGRSYASSSVGSRLCFKSEELAKYAFNQFKDIYNDFLK